VEDRITPGLYLEMTDRPEAAYAEERVPQLLALEGVTRATWWRNLLPDRADLPRRIDEFDLLGVFEVNDSFVAPTTPDDVRGLQFRHYPRPGQGRLTGQKTIGLSLVLISPRSPATAQELRDWADFIHIRYIAEVSVPGYSMITPYENVTGGEPRFLHFYEMDTEDPELAFKSMGPLVERILGRRTLAFQEWARGPLHIDYVNSFALVGERE
jgi:hypothetical protein